MQVCLLASASVALDRIRTCRERTEIRFRRVRRQGTTIFLKCAVHATQLLIPFPSLFALAKIIVSRLDKVDRHHSTICSAVGLTTEPRFCRRPFASGAKTSKGDADPIREAQVYFGKMALCEIVD
jgi:hypothetical protein